MRRIEEKENDRKKSEEREVTVEDEKHGDGIELLFPDLFDLFRKRHYMVVIQ